jgi:5,10-methylenetetrahydromethanopterin reductase
MSSQQVMVSLGLFPTEAPGRIVELVRLAEELGYACAYVGDSQMIWREAYVILGAAALATRRIRLALGVTNPLTRDPAVIAAAWDTLDELSGGRALLGIGTGDSSLQTLGRKPATLAGLERAIAVIRGLIAGSPVRDTESGAPIHLTYARPGTRVPLYVAVSSPRIHRLAGRIADGAIVLVGTDAAYLAASRREIEAGAAECDGDLRADRFRIVCWTPCSIQEDGAAARRAVKAHVARVLKRKLPFELDSQTMEVVHEIRQHYAYYEHMLPGTRHGDLVPDEVVERFAAAGTPTEALQQLQRLAATGLVDEIAIIPHTQDPGKRERIIRAVGAMIPSLAPASQPSLGTRRDRD